MNIIIGYLMLIRKFSIKHRSKVHRFEQSMLLTHVRLFLFCREIFLELQSIEPSFSQPCKKIQTFFKWLRARAERRKLNTTEANTSTVIPDPSEQFKTPNCLDFKTSRYSWIWWCLSRALDNTKRISIDKKNCACRIPSTTLRLWFVLGVLQKLLWTTRLQIKI